MVTVSPVDQSCTHVRSILLAWSGVQKTARDDVSLNAAPSLTHTVMCMNGVYFEHNKYYYN